jgi:mono/diheme cytochrome c family protein
MKKRIRILILSCALGPWFFFGCSGRRSEPLRGALDVSDPKISHGQVVYMEKCDKCHPGGDAGLGPSLNNKPLPGFMLGFQARHGMGAMPAFAEDELPKADLDDVVAYLKALRRNG